MSTEPETPFKWNPAHPIGTCGRCGAEMRYNVPRLGPDGGFVHAANGGLDCFANDLTIKIDHYFATVTPEQLDADLKAAHFDEYNKVGAPIYPSEQTKRPAGD